MARKKPPIIQGAPEWIVTYGDMMSLLLCFFILLAAFANYSDDDKRFMAAIESIRESLGNAGQSGFYVDNTVDFNSFLIKLESLAVAEKVRNLGHSDDPGADGSYYRVRKVRDGLELTVGGPIAFGQFSAAIEPDADVVLRKLASELIGKRNKLEIRGHATDEPLPIDATFRDPLDLSYARARAVRDRLVELGVEARAMRVTGAGAYEPLLQQTYSDERRTANRRVEIMITQALISDYAAKPQTPDELGSSSR